MTSDRLSSALSDIDATGLFGLVRYRLDEAEAGVTLTVNVDERPNDRVGVGVRYDDDRRAALLFTATLHNRGRYGSVTRLDLRVGEETRARIAYQRRHGVTGRFEGGTSVSWSQGRLLLPGAVREETGIDLTTISSFLGLVGERTTFFGIELSGEWATTGELAGARRPPRLGRGTLRSRVAGPYRLPHERDRCAHEVGAGCVGPRERGKLSPVLSARRGSMCRSAID